MSFQRKEFNHQEFGTRVKLARIIKKMNCRELASEVGFSCTDADIADLESGVFRTLTQEQLLGIANALRVSVDWLLGRVYYSDSIFEKRPDIVSLVESCNSLSDRNVRILAKLAAVLGEVATK